MAQPNEAPDKNYLSTKAVAEKLDVKEQTVRRWLKEHKLGPAYNFGSHERPRYFVHKNALARFTRARRVSA